MRLQELKSQTLYYQDQLNPILWQDQQLKHEIRYRLLLIARHFINFLKIPELCLKDIILSGSNAAYGYSEYSDIDLHLLVYFPKNRIELKELYDAKKNQYNTEYNITIKNINVELYVQNVQDPFYSAGIYSILNNHWIKRPQHQYPNITAKEIRNKAKTYSSKINFALRSNDLELAKKVLDELKQLRRAGLAKGGEESLENLTFKFLRNRGQINKLRKYINKLTSDSLSLGEQNEN